MDTITDDDLCWKSRVERSIGRSPMNGVLKIGREMDNDDANASDCCSYPRNVRRRFSSMYPTDVDAHPRPALVADHLPRHLPLQLRSIDRAVRRR